MSTDDLRKKIEDYKIKYNFEYKKLIKHILEPDILLYNQTVEKYKEKYLHPENRVK
jgi:hypothetical protein